VDLVKLAKQVEDEFRGLNEEIHIAVMGCVPEGEPVVTRQGPKPIETVVEGDEVLTHAGEFHPVEWMSTHAFAGELIEVQPTGFAPVRMTENHPVWAFPRPVAVKAGRERRPHLARTLEAGAEARWVPAGQLRTGWVLAYPVLQEKEDRATMVVEGVGEIPVDDDVLTLSGYYLAKGTMSGKGGRPYQQFFYFHESQRAYVERLRSALNAIGVTSQVRRRRHTAEVVTHSLALGEMLQGLFGHGAAHKRMPEWMERLPHAKQRTLVKALWEGDGYLGRVRGYWRATYCTASHALALQVHRILLRLGVAAFLHHRDQRGRLRNWVVSVTAQPALARLGEILGLGTVRECRAAGNPGQVVLDERALYVGVRAVRRVPYTGHVYNLEVKGVHSFALPGVVLHNCEVNGPGEARAADIGVAGGRGIGLIFKGGEVIRKVPEKDIVSAMREEVDRFLAERRAAKDAAGAGA
jgi:intein/homing endonuclease